jgi:uncharacterized protein YjbI with pentapeptide repeats
LARGAGLPTRLAAARSFPEDPLMSEARRTAPAIRWPWVAAYAVGVLVGSGLLARQMGRPALPGAKLRWASLAKARLARVNLCGADLRQANLAMAWLEGARLEGADLTSAVLSGANLRGANLRSANLTGANLEGANLLDTDLRDAVYDGNTTWPEGFDPHGSGAVLRQQTARARC